MPLKTPSFWYQEFGLKAALLKPVSLLYYAVHLLNQKLKTPYQSSIPVLCVGNIVMGGSGKTPTVLALIDLVQKNKLAKNPVILTRGYGGIIKRPTVVDTETHTHEQVGDEALLLAQKATVIVSPNRAQGAKKAEELRSDLIIMDDGFQNNSLNKDISLLVVDGINPFGNNQLFPAGPLRQTIKSALNQSDTIISIGPKIETEHAQFSASIEAEKSTLNLERNYVAFAGLGRPEKFKKTLEDLSVKITTWNAFADHHPYSNKECEALLSIAKENDAELITTEKDWVRLPADMQKKTKTLPISLSFDQDEKFISFLKERLKKC
ncbi:MAG: tetraacyldisaccharide 4'-kinase [Pseudomonadota bacterium]